MIKADYIGFWGGLFLSPERAATYQPRATQGNALGNGINKCILALKGRHIV